jgi:hypothetical protein
MRADALVKSARLADPAASTAAITWVGYDAPQTIIGFPPDGTDATNPAYAHQAGPVLDRFQDGLRATHEGAPSHNTVLGHSDGSTVVGYSAREQGLAADDLVFIGSLGVGADTAAELGHDPDHVWSGHIDNDPIQYGISPSELQVGIGLPDPSPGGTGLIHGVNPSDPGFGAQVFGAQDGSLGPDAHSQYWDRDSESLLNLGRLAARRRRRAPSRVRPSVRTSQVRGRRW